MIFGVDLLQLHDGRELRPGKLTVIVGPNNSGKTQTLRDLLGYLTVREARGVVVKRVDLHLPATLGELKEAARGAMKEQPDGNTHIKTLGATLLQQHAGGNLGQAANWEPVIQAYFDQARQGQRTAIIDWFGSHFVSFLRTEDRLRLTAKATTGMELGDVPNLLVALYRDRDPGTATRLDAFFRKAFGLSIRLDYSDLGQILFRVGESFEKLPEDQRLAAPFFAGLKTLDEQGDGMRSFVGTALGLLVGGRPVVLLDEPEAFLHPPQAVQLGELIAELASPDRQLFVATHSADILRGILNGGGDFDIVRLTQNEAGCCSTLLGAEDVRRIATDPVLSTTRVLEGLFYRAAIVVEADSDSAFYHRVARQVRPADDVLYTRAHNKQTLYKLLGPYRLLGVKAAAIADFDMIRRADELRPLLAAVTSDALDEPLALQEQVRAAIEVRSVVEQLAEVKTAVEKVLAEWVATPTVGEGPTQISAMRRSLDRAANAADLWADVKRRGRDALPEAAKLPFDRLRTWCAARGIFIVPIGELESWLVPHGVPATGNKARWIVDALTKLNELDMMPTAAPWSFVVEVHLHLLGATAAAETAQKS